MKLSDYQFLAYVIIGPSGCHVVNIPLFTVAEGYDGKGNLVFGSF